MPKLWSYLNQPSIVTWFVACARAQPKGVVLWKGHFLGSPQSVADAPAPPSQGSKEATF